MVMFLGVNMETVTLLAGVRLPRCWPRHVKSGLLHAISLAHAALTHARGWCLNSRFERVRLKTELERAHNDIACLTEEIRIKDARMRRIPAQRRPHYPPVERMAILELKAARGWSQALICTFSAEELRKCGLGCFGRGN